MKNSITKTFVYDKLYDPLEWDEFIELDDLKKRIKNECYKTLWKDIFGEYSEVYQLKLYTPIKEDSWCSYFDTNDRGERVTIADAANIFDSETFCYKFWIPSKYTVISILRKRETKTRSGISANLNWITYNETVTIEIISMVEER